MESSALSAPVPTMDVNQCNYTFNRLDQCSNDASVVMKINGVGQFCLNCMNKIGIHQYVDPQPLSTSLAYILYELEEQSSYFKYFSSLHSSKPVGDCLNLENSEAFFVGRENIPSEEYGSKLFIRKSYETLSQRMFSFRNYGSCCRFVISGTSGTGITFLRNYYAHYVLCNVYGDLVIIFAIGHENTFYFLHRRNGKLKVFNANRAGLYFFLKNNIEVPVFYLCDISNGDISYLMTMIEPSNKFYFYMFISPNDKATKELLKQSGTQLYLPLWDLEELIAAKGLIFELIDDNTVLKRFVEFGGVVRVVLGSDQTYNQHKESVLAAVKFFDLKKCDIFGYTSDNQDLKHRLQYLDAQDLDVQFNLSFNNLSSSNSVGVTENSKLSISAASSQESSIINSSKYEYRWGSLYILDLVTCKAIESIKNSMDNLFQSLSSSQLPIHGVVFKNIVHRLILWSTIPFKISRLGQGFNNTELIPGVQIDLSKLRRVLFSRESAATEIDAAPENSYCIPNIFNFPLVDAIVKLKNKPLIFLQITIAKREKSVDDSEYFKILLEALGVKKPHIFFVAPNQMYENDSAQSVPVDCHQYKMRISSIPLRDDFIFGAVINEEVILEVEVASKKRKLRQLT